MSELFIDAQPGETRIALVEDGRLAEVEVTRSHAQLAVGDIYLGRVEAVLPALDAAFIDIGLERPGFLALSEARPHGADGGSDGIGDYVGEGDGIMVQVQRDAFQDKGAKLTTRITLPGAVLVMAPGRPGIGVSKRIAGDETRQGVRARIQDLAGDGFIARTAAAGAGDDAIGRDLAALGEAWAEIVCKREAAKAPVRLHGELCPVLRRLRDGALAHRIVIDCPDTLARVRVYADRLRPDLAGRLHPYSGKAPLFEAEGLEDQIDAALDPFVALPGAALTVTASVDVIQALQGAAGDALAAAEVRLGRPLGLTPDPACPRESFHVGACDG